MVRGSRGRPEAPLLCLARRVAEGEGLVADELSEVETVLDSFLRLEREGARARRDPYK